MMRGYSQATRPGRSICLIVLLAGAPCMLAQGSAVRGEALFSGQTHFQNGAPACGSCHTVAGLRFPKGGTMGPDLTHEYGKLGPAAMQATLETLYFPAMTALFSPRPLTDGEQLDLTAFFQSADRYTPENLTAGLGLIAVFGFVILLGITWIKGRGRIRSVRRSLLQRAGVGRR